MTDIFADMGELFITFCDEADREIERVKKQTTENTNNGGCEK